MKLQQRPQETNNEHDPSNLAAVVPGRRIVSFLVPIVQWIARHEDRCELARLSDRDLRDIGLTRIEAMREVDKSFWQA